MRACCLQLPTRLGVVVQRLLLLGVLPPRRRASPMGILSTAATGLWSLVAMSGQQ